MKTAKEFLVMCCLAVGALIVLDVGLTAFGTSRSMVLTNGTRHQIEVFYTVKGRTTSRPYSYDIPSAGTERVEGVFGRYFTITSGNVEKVYRDVEPPAAATYKADFHGFFKEERVNAILKEDGCIYLRPPESSQPEGFPHCPHKQPDQPPPPPEVAPLSADQITVMKSDIKLRVSQWSCRPPAGGERIRPLYDLGKKETRYVREARERIELLRRRTKSSWEAASLAFESTQSEFHKKYRDPALFQHVVSSYFASGMWFNSMKAYGAVSDKYMEHLKTYDELCDIRNNGIRNMLADAPALALLRKAPHRPWLREQHAIPCSVAHTRNCMESDRAD